MISHIVSAFSGKPIFGQDGPKYKNKIYVSKQTICRKLSIYYKQITIQLSHSFYIISIATFLSLFWLYTRSACISAYYNLYFNLDTVVVLTKILVRVKKFVYSYNPQITKARRLL